MPSGSPIRVCKRCQQGYWSPRPEQEFCGRCRPVPCGESELAVNAAGEVVAVKPKPPMQGVLLWNPKTDGIAIFAGMDRMRSHVTTAYAGQAGSLKYMLCGTAEAIMENF